MLFRSKNICISLTIIIFSLITQSCFLMLLDLLEDEDNNNSKEISIYGYVNCNETKEPIPGIHVTVQGVNGIFQRTGKNGYFYITVPKKEKMTVIFEDVDGPHNGGLFTAKTVDFTIKKQDTTKYLNVIFLDK